MMGPVKKGGAQEVGEEAAERKASGADLEADEPTHQPESGSPVPDEKVSSDDRFPSDED
jgi:hypothetical protein